MSKASKSISGVSRMLIWGVLVFQNRFSMQNRRLNFFGKIFFQPQKWAQKAIFGRKLHFSSAIMRCKNACKMDTINIFGKPESSRTRYIPLALVNSSWNNFYGSFCDVASNWRFAKNAYCWGLPLLAVLGPFEAFWDERVIVLPHQVHQNRFHCPKVLRSIKNTS